MTKVRQYILVGLLAFMAESASAALICGGGDEGRCDRYNVYYFGTDRADFDSLPSGGVRHRTLQCASGEIAISGGIDTLTPEGVSGRGFGIIDSYHNPSNHRQWIFKIKNQNTATAFFRFSIVCAVN